MSFRIYLVEDDANLNLVLATYLQTEQWQVFSFISGKEAGKAITVPPDLWILDIMLPDIDGYQLIRKIKAVSPQVPVIFISARDAEIDRVVGLEFGSDDYLAKPFLPRELVIRTKKLLDRVYNAKDHGLAIYPYSVDKTSRTVKLHEKAIDLTSKELDLLLYFMMNQARALSREQVLTHVWGDGYFGVDRVVDDLVRRLRKKMPLLRIETIYGYGYRMMKP